MDISRIEQIAREHLADRRVIRDREPGWAFYHGCRTAKIAMRLCDELDVRTGRDTIYAGALFHDAGKGSENHHVAGEAAARELLRDVCAPDELDAVCDIVGKHCLRNRASEFTEAVRIVQDADLLDHFGPIESWLAFYWSGVRGAAFGDHLQFKTGEGSIAERRRKRAMLNYDASKRMFDDRLAWEEEFFSRFHRVYREGM
ncbi:MAG: HD domain-containing protein [Anaerolineales bacterium]|jgi:uncharacterized protein